MVVIVRSILFLVGGTNFGCDDLWKDFEARSRCIEVLYRPNKEDPHKILTKVYFDFDPLVMSILV